MSFADDTKYLATASRRDNIPNRDLYGLKTTLDARVMFSEMVKAGEPLHEYPREILALIAWVWADDKLEFYSYSLPTDETTIRRISKWFSMQPYSQVILAQRNCGVDMLDWMARHGVRYSDYPFDYQYHRSILSDVAAMGIPFAINHLIEMGASPLTPSPTDGTIPLHHAGSSEAARYLVEAGCDINTQDNTGSTAMHSAARSMVTDVVLYLASRGAKQIIDNNGFTPIECLIYAKHL